MEDLFTQLHIEGTEEFPNLPRELQGIDLEPEPLRPINILDETQEEFLKIAYAPGESPALNRMVGCNFLKEGKNSYYFSELAAKKFSFPDYINDKEDYILVIFKREELEAVIRMFHLPSYTFRDSYQFRDLVSHQYLQFD